ncbi:MAG: oligosaccharide flippase family protein [Thermoanaerobaculia bacterium]
MSGRRPWLRMGVLGRNIASNLAARSIASLLSLLFIPLYVRILGIEAWGLIGFSLMLQSIFAIFDFGLGLTLNRELARRRGPDGAAEAGDLVRTYEAVSWIFAAVASLVVIAASGWIATNWIRSGTLAPETLERAIRLMGVMFGLQIPFWLYQGGLFGLERHFALNVITTATVAVRHGGAALVLLFVAPTIETYFGWLIVATGLQTALTGGPLWRSIRRPFFGSRFRAGLLARSGSFTAAVSVNGVFAPLVTQIDKIILSALVPLEDFGVYTLAWSLAAALWMLVAPVTTALFPRFARLVEDRNEEELAALYHRVTRALAVVLAPAAMLLITFPQAIVLLWSGDAAVAERAQAVLPFLAAGTMLAGLATVPLTLQMAAGKPRLVLYTNVAAICVLTPATLILGRQFGIPGVAALWAAVGLGYVLAMTPIMHRGLLRRHYGRWLGRDVALPVAAAAIATIPWRFASPLGGSASAIPVLAAAWLVALVLCVLLSGNPLRALARS